MKINVDAIFVISLPERTERRMTISTELMGKDIYEFNFVNAVKDDNGIAGLHHSMNNLLFYCLTKGFQKVLILEDDGTFEEGDSIELINKCIEQLPEDFHILQLGANIVEKPEKYSENLLSVSYTHSTHANIYSRAAMEIVHSILDYKTHLDALIHKTIQPFNKCFVSFPMIMNQRDGYSDIEKKETRYGTMMKRKYNQMTKDI